MTQVPGFPERDKPTADSAKNRREPESLPEHASVRGAIHQQTRNPDRVRGNLWLLTIGGGVIAGLLGGFVAGPRIRDRLARSAQSLLEQTNPGEHVVERGELPANWTNPREQVIERVEFPAIWLPKTLYDLRRHLPSNSPVLQASSEALRDYLGEHGLVQSEVAVIVNAVMLEGDDQPSFVRINVYEACESTTPYRMLILDAVAGKLPSSTFVGILGSDAIDDLAKLRLPIRAKAEFRQELTEMVK
jgi:hypothetical protein